MKSLVLLCLVFTTLINAQTWSTRKEGSHIRDYYYPLSPINNNQSKLGLHKLEIHSWVDPITQELKRQFNLFEYAVFLDNYVTTERYDELKSMYSLSKYTIESALISKVDLRTEISAPNYYSDKIAESVTALSFNNEVLVDLKTSGFYNLANSDDIFTGIIVQTDLDVINTDTLSLQKAKNKYKEMAEKQKKWFKHFANGSVGNWTIKSKYANGYHPDKNCQYYFDHDANVSGPLWSHRVFTFRESLCGSIYLKFSQQFVNAEQLIKTIRDNFIIALKMDDETVNAPSVIAIFDFSKQFEQEGEEEIIQSLDFYAHHLQNSSLNDWTPLLVTPKVFINYERRQIVMKLIHANK